MNFLRHIDGVGVGVGWGGGEIQTRERERIFEMNRAFCKSKSEFD
jgi:hypothetical protein